MAWQRAASLKSIPEDGVRGVEVEGVPLALYNLDGTIYATHGVCTHAMALLAEGFVEDGKIECPLHQGLFDIRTGAALGPPVTTGIQTFAVKVEGDDVLVDLQRSAATHEEARQDTAPAAVRAPDANDGRSEFNDSKVSAMNANPPLPIGGRYVWPKEGLRRIPDWVYTDQTIYEREVEKIFHGRTWNYVALECELPNPGDFIRSNVGPTPVVVSRAEDGSINVFENRCAHRAAEFCRELSGNAKEFVCPYHQWSYDLKGYLAGVPFRRGVGGRGGMPADFNTADHGLRRLNVTAHRGVVFASYADGME